MTCELKLEKYRNQSVVLQPSQDWSKHGKEGGCPKVERGCEMSALKMDLILPSAVEIQFRLRNIIISECQEIFNGHNISQDFDL